MLSMIGHPSGGEPLMMDGPSKRVRPRAAGETPGVLPCSVLGEVTDGQLGHHHHAHGGAGLRLNEPQLAADALGRT